MNGEGTFLPYGRHAIDEDDIAAVTHEAGLRASLHEQDLKPAISVPPATAQQDHGCRRTRDCGFHERPAYSLDWRLMAAETTTKQLYICTSCGFIYDPDEGDPDGGIPAGTAFEDIPADWFCPVCGARKADFSPFED